MIADPLPSSPVAAVNWATELMIETVGTAIAVLVVAAIGMAMLRGRLPFRNGVAAIIGCFILFSSRSIADGLMEMSGVDSKDTPSTAVEVLPAYVAPVPPPVPYDPYAGASVPVRPQDSSPKLLPR